MKTTSQSYNNILNVYELFEKQASKTPGIIAAQDAHNKVTYSELKERITFIANCINHQANFSKSKFIGICMEPCIDIVATIFAILKAGFAYIPIDPEYPAERINYIMNDAKLELVITNTKTIDTLKEENKFHLIDSKYFACLEYLQKEKFESKQKRPSNDLTYVIYTSGSTGNPKGVIVSHQNILNYARWVKDYLDLNQSEIFDCSSSFSFDLTVTVSIIPLLYGSSVFICNKNTKKSPSDYLTYLQKNKISIIKTTPSYFNLLCDFVDNFDLTSVKKIILGGENLSLKHVKKWLSKYPAHVIINEYGPTETTVGVTKAIIDSKNIHTLEYIPLGSPGINVRLKVLDKNKCPVLKGEIGELYIAGTCVTKGYLNKDELTKEKFILLKNNEDAALELMYKTGDLVRFHGSFEQLEYVGRTDEQIKLRGYRIELGEIENKLLNFNGIKLAAVVHRKNDNHSDLVAYYMPERNIIVNKNALKKFLQSVLPEYMLPSMYIELKEATLTVNGKLDKANLPDINSFLKKQNIKPAISVNPTTLLQLKNIWANLVSLNEVDLSTNFFDMGGNSLTLAKFCKQLNDKGLNIGLTDLFLHPTLESLAKHIGQPKEEIFDFSYKPKEQRNYMLRSKKILISQVS